MVNNRPVVNMAKAPVKPLVLKVSEQGKKFIMDWEGLARWGTSKESPAFKKLFPYDTAEKMVHGKFPPYNKEFYLDYHNSKKDWTIGYGHKIQPNEKQLFKDGITEAEAIRYFTKDLAFWEDWIKNNILNLPKVKEKPLSQNQFDALASYIFNLGAIKYSTLAINKGKHVHTKLYNALVAGDYDKASEQMDVKTSGGVFSQGLANRRDAERQIWKKGVYPNHSGYAKHKHSQHAPGIMQQLSTMFKAHK